jgi:hypothetical protein
MVIRVARLDKSMAVKFLFLGPVGGHLFYAGYRRLPIFMTIVTTFCISVLLYSVFAEEAFLTLLTGIGGNFEVFIGVMVFLVGCLLSRTLYDWTLINNDEFRDFWGDQLVHNTPQKLSASGLTLVDCRMRDIDHAVSVFDEATALANPFLTLVLSNKISQNQRLNLVESIVTALSALTHICASADKAARLVEILPLYAVHSIDILGYRTSEEARQYLVVGDFTKIDIETFFSSPASFGALTALLKKIREIDAALVEPTGTFLLDYVRLVAQSDRQEHEREQEVLQEVAQFLGIDSQ